MLIMTYQNPDGEETLGPSEEELREIIFERGPEYYENSGSAALYGSARRPDGVVTHSIHNTPSLCWFLRTPAGFHFQFGPAKGPTWITFDGSDTTERVKHHLGGEPTFMPRACFVPRDAAWEIVREFLETQGRWPGVGWICSLDFHVDTNRPG